MEAGGPPLRLADLDDRDEVWADIAPKLYAQAAAGQWDPATAVDWAAPRDHDPADVEAAVVQVMTYLVENEQAALVVPARFLGRIHPHFREVVQLLAVQVADEARHVEVFTRRALLAGGPLGTSGAGGRASLARRCSTKPTSPWPPSCCRCWARARFLDLLALPRAPRPRPRHPAGVPAWPCRTRPATSPSAWPTSSTRRPAEPSCSGTASRAAVERRHDVLARHRRAQRRGLRRPRRAGRRRLDAGRHRRGLGPGAALTADMDEGRQRRLVRLGFPPDEAAALSALHTRNFM